MSRSLVALALAGIVAASTPAGDNLLSYEQWLDLFPARKAEQSPERAAAFAATVERMAVKNAAEGTNGAKYTAAHPYADRTEEERTRGGCLKGRPEQNLDASSKFAFTEEEMHRARNGASIDWRKHGAVAPVQQQHPFGTCWAFSMIAATEGIMVVQGKHELQKLSEQMVVSCVPEEDCGQSADVLWKWLLATTGGKVQLEDVYHYNRTCNFFREQQLAPDGTTDGYNETCNLPGPPPYAPCPPCPGITRKDGTPPCLLDPSKGFSNAQVQGWGFIATDDATNDAEMVAALVKYGPGGIGIDASCVEGYTGGIVSNCTSSNVDHAVTIIGAETDNATGMDYWIVKNSWNTTFGEEGFFRVQRGTKQMGINGAVFGCYDKDCTITV